MLEVLFGCAASVPVGSDVEAKGPDAAPVVRFMASLTQLHPLVRGGAKRLKSIKKFFTRMQRPENALNVG